MWGRGLWTERNVHGGGGLWINPRTVTSEVGTSQWSGVTLPKPWTKVPGEGGSWTGRRRVRVSASHLWSYKDSQVQTGAK